MGVEIIDVYWFFNTYKDASCKTESDKSKFCLSVWKLFFLTCTYLLLESNPHHSA